MSVSFWLWAALFFGIIEAISPTLMCIWLGFGAVLTALASVYVGSFIAQLGIFLVSSIVFFFATKRKIQGGFKAIPTNSDSIIGKEAVVIEKIDNLKASGRIMVGAQDWLCKSKTDDVIEKGSVVKIISIQGNRAVVELVSDKC